MMVSVTPSSPFTFQYGSTEGQTFSDDYVFEGSNLHSNMVLLKDWVFFLKKCCTIFTFQYGSTEGLVRVTVNRQTPFQFTFQYGSTEGLTLSLNLCTLCNLHSNMVLLKVVAFFVAILCLVTVCVLSILLSLQICSPHFYFS